MAVESASDQVIPQSYRDTTVIRELPLGSWRAIIQNTPESSVFVGQELTHELIQHYISGEHLVSEQLISALKTIFELGVEDGRTLLEQASADVQLGLDSSDHESDRELAARLWVLSQSDIRYSNILMRAHVSYEYLNRKISNIREYSGASGFAVDKVDTEAIQVLVSRWCSDNGKSEVVTISAYKKDNFWFCNITRGDPIKHVTEVKQNSLATFSYHPAVWDHVRIEPETGRIGISSRSPKLIALYREAFGSVLTGNRNYFSHEKVCSLVPLQVRGKSLFDSYRPHNLRFVNLTELKWQGGNGSDTFIVKGKDCFKVIEDLQVNFQAGELTEAKLSFNFYGLSRPINVVINPPYRIVVPDGVNQDVIFTYLNKIGLRGKFDGDVSSKTFWELNPWFYSEEFWRKQLGSDFDTLKKYNCFTEKPLETVTHPDHSATAGVLIVEEINSNTFIGISENISIGVRTLTATDRIGYELDLIAVVSFISNSLSIKGSVLEEIKGILTLGFCSFSDSLKIKVYLAVLAPNEHDDALMRQYANGNRFVLIIPNGCAYKSANAVVGIDLTSLNFDSLTGDVVRSLGLERDISPSIWVSAELILAPDQNKIWYKKVEIPGVNFSEIDFKFVKIVSEAKGNVVNTVFLNETLTGTFDSSHAKRAKSSVMKKIIQALKDAGVSDPIETNEIFKGHKGGYSLECSVHIL